jgi:hypothetical protein
MTTATSKTVRLPGLTIDFSAVRAVLSSDDRPIWAGKLVLTSDGRADGQIKVVTANMVHTALVDLEGDCDADDPIYGVVERWQDFIVNAVAAELGRATYAEAMAA